MALDRQNYITRFAGSMVSVLLEHELLEINPDSGDEVAIFVGKHLQRVSSGGQLFTNLTKALIVCPDVIELYADDDQLKEFVTRLKY